MPPLPPENSSGEAQRGSADGSMLKRENSANVVLTGQPEGLAYVFAHFYVAHRLFSNANPHSSRLELHKNDPQREHEQF